LTLTNTFGFSLDSVNFKVLDQLKDELSKPFIKKRYSPLGSSELSLNENLIDDFINVCLFVNSIHLFLILRPFGTPKDTKITIWK
jgi:hypothetical protein